LATIIRISLHRDWQVKENFPAAPVLPASEIGSPLGLLTLYQPASPRYPGTRPGRGVPPTNLNDLEARVRLLDQLSRGLAKEVLLWKEGNDPLLYRERQDYLVAIRAALSGVECARVTLAKARQRLENEG
jgi:hypothetical protein